MPATLLIQTKRLFEDGLILEVVTWRRQRRRAGRITAAPDIDNLDIEAA